MPAQPGRAQWYIGLMSGTSLDGIDAVLVDCAREPPHLIAHHHAQLPDALRAELLTLNTSGPDELHRSHLAARGVAECYAAAVESLLRASVTAPSAVRAIGAHGQTVRHRPDLAYTVQLNDPARLAELTGIDVVADFRSRDIAAGGQGAPLVPAFHRIAFATDVPRAVVNIGGICNITALTGDGACGFDAGPGNVLLDAWTARHFDAAYDRDGNIARQFPIDHGLVEAWLADPYFAAAPPKSTGRDLFTLDWLLRAERASALPPGTVLASLTELTARAAAQSIEHWCATVQDVVVCGGGARNATLIGRLEAHCGGRPVIASDALGVAAEHVEALAFAWLAYRHCHRQPGNVPSATGARGPRVLGALYPAR
jgi:anhydro-N-acetylmuramic acid kinase